MNAFANECVGTFIAQYKTRKTKLYLYKCINEECQNIIKVQKQHLKLRNGKCRSCNKKMSYRAAYQLMCRMAKKRKFEVSITLNDYIKLVKMPCYYCSEKLAVKEFAKHNYSVSAYCIDRKNNNEGYTSTNSVACCPSCNIAKHSLNSDLYIELCRKVAANWNKQN